ncbi:MFS multidrug transporter [Cercophora scortea]|uniref:MFS multidrug transporter n=1 Tax=Cercophora scortea TaxID=314031 RepID=A0AAE0I8J0_9PEZI|nr:MFS multidrug transporter [Cercophora scortea]
MDNPTQPEKHSEKDTASSTDAIDRLEKGEVHPTTLADSSLDLKPPHESDQPPADVVDSTANAPGETTEGYITGFRLWLILISGTVVQFLIMLDHSVLATAIPRITTEFDSLLDVAWYGSAYQLASACLQPLTGKMYTFMRTKAGPILSPSAISPLTSIQWTFLSFFAIFELGSLLCALASSSTMLIIARAVAGMGSSGLMNGGLTVVSAVLPKHKRPAMLGATVATGQLGQALGPLIGGALTERVSWRWCFYINLPIGALVFAFLFFIDIPDGPGIAKPSLRTLARTIVTTLDLVGFVLFVPAAAMFFLALQFGGNQHPWNSATVIGLFCGAGATLLVFFFWERLKGDAAMIPLSILRMRIVWSSSVAMFFIVGVLTCAVYFLPIFFQAVLVVSPITSGVYFLPNVLFQITFSVLAGIMVQRFGYYLPWILSGLSLSAIGFGLLSLLTPTYSTAARVGFQILAGAGCGAAATMPFIAVQNLIPHAQISVAMAILVFCLNFGGATFLTLAQTDFSQSLRVNIPKYAPDVDASAIIKLGATGFQRAVSPAELPGVLMAYSKSLDNVFYLVAGASVGAFIFAWGMGWEDIRKYKTKQGDDSEMVGV